MVGIGETKEEVIELINDLHNHGCDIMTIGQYLQPTKNHLPKAVESSPLVRSSYHADKHAELI